MIMVLIILLVIGAGMFAVNQTLGYMYKSEFLQDPCGLCIELNPTFECRIPQSNLYNINLSNFNFSLVEQ